MYAIDNADYPQDFLKNITVPVTEETLRNCVLSPTLRSQLKPGTDFPFSLDRAIATADRHMLILDPTSKAIHLNPPELVERLGQPASLGGRHFLADSPRQSGRTNHKRSVHA